MGWDSLGSLRGPWLFKQLSLRSSQLCSEKISGMPPTPHHLHHQLAAPAQAIIVSYMDLHSSHLKQTVSSTATSVILLKPKSDQVCPMPGKCQNPHNSLQGSTWPGPLPYSSSLTGYKTSDVLVFWNAPGRVLPHEHCISSPFYLDAFSQLSKWLSSSLISHICQMPSYLMSWSNQGN